MMEQLSSLVSFVPRVLLIRAGGAGFCWLVVRPVWRIFFNDGPQAETR